MENRVQIQQLPSEERVLNRPYIVGVAGGSASGKTTICKRICEAMALDKLQVLSFDSFYITPPKGCIMSEYNFDHPDALDFNLFHKALLKLYNNQAAEIPVYSFKEHRRMEETQMVYPTKMILVEGILAFHSDEICKLLDLRIFVDCDDDTRLHRRVKRDVNERGRDVSGIIYQYNRFVKPAYNEFIFPTMKKAHLIIPGRAGNNISIQNVTQFLMKRMHDLDQSEVKEISPIKIDNLFHSDWNHFTDGDLSKENCVFLDKEDYLEMVSLTTCLLKNEFSKTLFKLFVNQLLEIGMEDVLKKFGRDHVNYHLAWYEDVEDDDSYVPEDQERDDSSKTTHIDTIILPFLDEITIPILKGKLSSYGPTSENKKILLITAFTSYEGIKMLRENYKDLILFVGLCVNIKEMMEVFNSNIKVREYDFYHEKSIAEDVRATFKLIFQRPVVSQAIAANP